MRHRFVVFDLDGTLVDSSWDITRSLNAALAEWGLPALSREAVVSFVGDGSRRLVDRAVAAVGGRLEIAPAVAERFLQIYGQHLLEETRPYPGIPELLELLERLETVPLCVCSNKHSQFVDRVLSAMGWQDRFLVALGGDWGGPTKPAPDPLLHIAARLGRHPSEGVMVGDGVTDIEAARAAGFLPLGVAWGYRPKQDLADKGARKIFDSPKTLGDYLENILDGKAPLT